MKQISHDCLGSRNLLLLKILGPCIARMGVVSDVTISDIEGSFGKLH